MLSKKQQQEIEKIIQEITEEAKSVVEDYTKNPSQISGSIVQIHETSPLLDKKNVVKNKIGRPKKSNIATNLSNNERKKFYELEQFYQKAKLTPEIISLRNGIQTAIAITSAALSDRTSKGCHYIKE